MKKVKSLFYWFNIYNKYTNFIIKKECKHNYKKKKLACSSYFPTTELTTKSRKLLYWTGTASCEFEVTKRNVYKRYFGGLYVIFWWLAISILFYTVVLLETLSDKQHDIFISDRKKIKTPLTKNP